MSTVHELRKEEETKEYYLKVSVDENAVKEISGESDVIQAITNEAGWMHDSGIFIEEVLRVDDEKFKEKTITIPADMVKNIRDFCKDELDWHINNCEPEEYLDECKAEIFLLKNLGFEEDAKRFEDDLTAALEEAQEEIDSDSYEEEKEER